MVEAADVLALLPGFAELRPVFHSEADLQLAFAWHVQTVRPDLSVRLETRPAPGRRLDMLVIDPADHSTIATELKYLTRAWQGAVEGEFFALKEQGAQDIRSYDCVKDVVRVESALADGFATSGLVLIITNDSSYWTASGRGETNAAEFRLYEGTVLSGARAWRPQTGAGTMAARRSALFLTGTYQVSWHEYSTLPGKNGRFRYLGISIDAPTERRQM